MTACPPEEEHVFPVLLLTFLLRRRGWDVLYLGANVPVEQMAATITATRPQLAIFGAQQLHTAANLLAMARALQHEDIPLGFGGGVFNRSPVLAARIPGHFLGLTLEQVLPAAEYLMAAPRPASPVEPPAQAYEAALAHYRERQLLVDAGAWQNMQAQGIAPEVPGWAGRRLARCIVAALSLGSMTFLDGEMEWLRHMGGDLTVSPGLLAGFLQAYYHAAQAHLDERGAPVVDWLARQVDDG
ncbi:MAG: cobalamin B12-binding domain-containing protein [Chloroflexi bacterium]|nr:cobalamin B12-binding domain-containing protein [Chloroflexota bacterium]